MGAALGGRESWSTLIASERACAAPSSRSPPPPSPKSGGEATSIRPYGDKGAVALEALSSARLDNGDAGGVVRGSGSSPSDTEPSGVIGATVTGDWLTERGEVTDGVDCALCGDVTL